MPLQIHLDNNSVNSKTACDPGNEDPAQQPLTATSFDDKFQGASYRNTNTKEICRTMSTLPWRQTETKGAFTATFLVASSKQWFLFMWLSISVGIPHPKLRCKVRTWGPAWSAVASSSIQQAGAKCGSVSSSLGYRLASLARSPLQHA